MHMATVATEAIRRWVVVIVGCCQTRGRHRRAHRRRPPRRRSRCRDRRRQINDALLEHKVIFFRDQHDLDDDGQLAFAHALGTPTTRAPDGDLPRRHGAARSTRATTRPTAGTPTSRSSTASRRRHCCGQSPCRAYGGTTTWASTEAAYDQLPEPLRALAENLWAVHTNAYDYVGDVDAGERQPADTERAVPRGVRVRLLRDRAPGGAGTSRDRQARAAARPLRQTVRRTGPCRVGDAVRAVAGANHQTGEHDSLELAARRPRDLGQPRHPALRRRRLRRPVPPAQPRDARRGHPPRRPRRAQPGVAGDASTYSDVVAPVPAARAEGSQPVHHPRHRTHPR